MSWLSVVTMAARFTQNAHSYHRHVGVKIVRASARLSWSARDHWRRPFCCSALDFRLPDAVWHHSKIKIFGRRFPKGSHGYRGLPSATHTVSQNQNFRAVHFTLVSIARLGAPRSPSRRHPSVFTDTLARRQIQNFRGGIPATGNKYPLAAPCFVSTSIEALNSL